MSTEPPLPPLWKLLTALVVAALGVVVSAQAVEFDVVSVKEHAPGDPREFMVAQGGRFVAAISLKMLIRTTLQIFTALQEQLGLRLESTRETVDVLVIDSVERPAPN